MVVIRRYKYLQRVNAAEEAEVININIYFKRLGKSG